MSLALNGVAIASFVVVCFVYCGYPLTLPVLSVLGRRKPVRKEPITPGVSLLISCYNEQDVIRSKLDNSLALDYPPEKLEIIVVSDASDDGTDDIVREFGDRNVKLVRQEERRGKTSALNLAVAQSSGEIVVFSDANAFYETDAIRELVSNFADEEVGYVVGDARYTDAEESSGKSESLYWRYEGWIKRLETRVHSIVGGDGAIYAIRRALYEPLLEQDINDFVNPLQIVLKGYRGVYEPAAICRETTAGSFDKEFRRKARIVNRSFTGLMRVKGVLNPIRTGLFAFEIWFHKLLRWLVPVFIVLFVLSCLALSFQGSLIHTVAASLFVLFYWLFYAGFVLPEPLRGLPFFSLPYYFVVVNVAALVGLYGSLRGQVQVTWSTPRAAAGGPAGVRPTAANLIAHTLFIALSAYLLWALPTLF